MLHGSQYPVCKIFNGTAFTRIQCALLGLPVRKLFCDAQPWINVPSTVKCSSLIKRLACLLISAKNCCATSLVSNRSRFFAQRNLL